MPAPSSISRRSFMMNTAALSAAAVVTPELLARSARAGASDQIKVGLVGCGGRGTGAAVQALRADPSTVLWALGDAFEDKIRPSLDNITGAMNALDEEQGSDTWAKKIRLADRRFHGFDAFRRVIDSGVDVVLLCTPPNFRPAHLAACVDAGKHVFCEKPCAVDSAGVRSVLDSAAKAKSANLSLMSGFCWRHQFQVNQAFGKVLEGAIGDVSYIQTTYNTTGWVPAKPRQGDWSDAEFMLRNWQYFHPLSGDHIVEQSVHAIDWIAWAMRDQPPVRCYAVGGRQVREDTPETGNVYDHFSVTYEYPSGVRATNMCRHWPNSASDNTAFIQGSAGNLNMQPWTGNHVITGKTPWRGDATGNDMYQREHDVLFKAVRNGSAYNDGVRMAHSTLLAIMGREAAYTGQTVTWADALNAEHDLNPEPWEFSSRTIPTVAIPGTTRFG
ncbi:MAG: Gfo/Idh/MocA family protein [Phycisphaerales bacterium JB040]